MEQKSISESLISTLNEISKNEINEISLLIAITKKSIMDLINKNIQQINDEFLEKCEYYGRSISEVNSEKVEILNGYKEEFNKIATKLEEEYINLALEVQDAQANQKIAIAEMKKNIDLKEKYTSSAKVNEFEIESLNKKIDMLAERYIKYCGFEEACLFELSGCHKKVENAINSVMQFENGKQLVVIEKRSILKVFSKLLKFLSNEKRFKKDYIEKKKKNIEKIKISTNYKLEEIDKGLNDSLIILDAYNSKIIKVCN